MTTTTRSTKRNRPLDELVKVMPLVREPKAKTRAQYEDVLSGWPSLHGFLTGLPATTDSLEKIGELIWLESTRVGGSRHWMIYRLYMRFSQLRREAEQKRINELPRKKAASE